MSRWITVANRLPFSLNSDGRSTMTASGGLVSALSGVQHEGERLWIGCAPERLNEADWPRLERTMLSEQENTGAKNPWRYHPVFTAPELYDSYYNGLCNDVLWPLLHYQPELVAFSSESWTAYCEVNQRIAKEIASVALPDDLIWIHDFHLFLVPKILKALRPELKVGFFLHVPFPSSELFRQLPVREQILDSLLHADLIGFHDYSYLQHFCSAVLRILGFESQFLAIRHSDRTTRLGVFPVSIDTDAFLARAHSEKVQVLSREMSREMFVFLGVDRLDYMKGIDLKLKAFQNLLKRFEQYRERVCLIQVAVPTRQGVPVYAQLARETACLVGEINGEFSTPNWSPIQYIHASVNSDQLIALYRTSDALLVSSKRDGMNLVALEYIASQGSERPGLVLLSEFAGASSTCSHALPINPWDLDETARRMQIAMEMPKQEKLFRTLAMQKYLKTYTATHWAESFIAELDRQVSTANKDEPPIIVPDQRAVEMLRDRILVTEPKRLVIFLDYDGTLVPIEASPELAVLTPELHSRISALTRYPWLDLIIVSGRDSRFLEKQFADLSLHLVAEHGAKHYNPRLRRWQRRVHRSRAVWYPVALKIISDYASRVPSSQIEKKSFAITWHYRQSPQDYAEVQARKLTQELELGLANLPVNVMRGKKVVEVRATEANKGAFASGFLEQAAPGTFALAIGDDRTDEDLFLAVKGRGVSIHIGAGPSQADAALAQQSQAMALVERLLASLHPGMPEFPAKSAQKHRQRAYGGLYNGTPTH